MGLNNRECALEDEIIKLLDRVVEFYERFNPSVDGYTISTSKGTWVFHENKS